MKALLCISLLLAVASPEDAQIKEARRLIEREVAFVKGRAVLQRLLRRKALSPQVRAQALELLGHAQIALRETDDAQESYLALLGLRPEFRPDPLASPFVHRVFKKELLQHRARAPALQEVSAVAEPGGARIGGRLKDPAALVSALHLYTRILGQPRFQGERMKLNVGTFDKRLEMPQGGRLEFYLEGVTAAEARIVFEGDAQNPRTLILQPVQESATEVAVAPAAWYQKWWVWTIVGAAVVGGSVTAVILTLPSNDFGTGGVFVP